MTSAFSVAARANLASIFPISSSTALGPACQISSGINATSRWRSQSIGSPRFIANHQRCQKEFRSPVSMARFSSPASSASVSASGVTSGQRGKFDGSLPAARPLQSAVIACQMASEASLEKVKAMIASLAKLAAQAASPDGATPEVTSAANEAANEADSAALEKAKGTAKAVLSGNAAALEAMTALTTSGLRCLLGTPEASNNRRIGSAKERTPGASDLPFPRKTSGSTRIAARCAITSASACRDASGRASSQACRLSLSFMSLASIAANLGDCSPRARVFGTALTPQHPSVSPAEHWPRR